jgi:hypothetical protein
MLSGRAQQHQVLHRFGTSCLHNVMNTVSVVRLPENSMTAMVPAFVREVLLLRAKLSPR